MGIKHSFVSPKPDVSDVTKVRPTNWNDDHEIDGDVDFDGHNVTNLADEAYNQTAWNGSLEAPTKNAIRDKIEALVLTGGGVTDFLALDDSPDTYTGFGSETDTPKAGAFLGVNQSETAVEFRYSTSDYVDIRDYGTVADGGSITTALQAALDAVSTGTNRQRTIRIPCVGSGDYTCGAITFPSNVALTIELDCSITTSATWSIEGGTTIRGLRNLLLGATMPYGPFPGAGIGSGGSVDPCIFLDNVTNCRLENLSISANAGKAVYILGGSQHTLRDCALTNSQNAAANQPPLKVDSCFWGQATNIRIAPGNHLGMPDYAAEFTTDTNVGPNCGIWLCQDWVVHNRGILFRPVYGPEGVNHFEFKDLHSEDVAAGSDLFTFDTSSGNRCGFMRFIRMSISDAIGGGNGIFNNIGPGLVQGIHFYNFQGASSIFATGSEPIKNFVHDLSQSAVSTISTSMPPSLAKTYADEGPYIASSYSQVGPGYVDAKLMSAPIGVPWVIYTPLAVRQNPADWNSDGGVITTGILAPDGSTMAGSVTGAGGASCYGVNRSFAVGDWVVYGCWMRDPNGGPITSFDQQGTQIIFLTVGGVELAGYNLSEHFLDNGWVWVCSAWKIPSTLTNVDFGFSLALNGTTKEFFNPSMLVIPASAGYDDPWIINFARSTKGGWSSNAAAASIGFPDHQPVYAKAGVLSDKFSLTDGVTAPATVAGKAQIYVDTADGDLKVKFGDGTIKTIVVDT